MAEMINDSMTLVLLFMYRTNMHSRVQDVNTKTKTMLRALLNYKCLTNYNHSLQTKEQSNANDNGIL